MKIFNKDTSDEEDQWNSSKDGLEKAEPTEESTEPKKSFLERHAFLKDLLLDVARASLVAASTVMVTALISIATRRDPGPRNVLPYDEQYPTY